MPGVDVPVVIVGAGPVGLCAGLFLARQGIRPLVLERHPGTSIHPRARGLGARTMELFRELSLEEQVRHAGRDLDQSRGWVAGMSLASMNLAEDPRKFDFSGRLRDQEATRYTPSPGMLCPQHYLEPVLLSAATAAGVDVRFRSEVMGVDATDNDAVVKFRDAQGRTHSLRTSYIIGADGPRSTIRTHCGIAMTGHRFHRRFVSVYFRADLSPLVEGNEFIGCQLRSPAAEGALYGVDNRHLWLFMKPVRPGESRADYPDGRCYDLVRTAIGLPILDVEILSVLEWNLTSGIAAEFRRGRIFLAGDAAHIMPISGGFGANTGIQDAHNLAWKLAAVLRGFGGPGLLSTYHAERHQVASFTLRQALLRTSYSPLRWATSESAEQRRADVGMVNSLIVDVGYRYGGESAGPQPGSGLAGQRLLSGLPGTRAPHCWVTHEGRRKSTLDLFGRCFVVLAGPSASHWCSAARAAAHALGVPLSAYCVGPGMEVHDPGGEWQAAAGVGRDGVIVVRPDGFILWRAPTPPAAGQDGAGERIRDVLAHALGRPASPVL